MRNSPKRAAVIGAVVVGLLIPAAIASAKPKSDRGNSAAAQAAHKPGKAAKAAKAGKPEKPGKSAKVRDKFVHAGTVTGVDLAAGTVTLTVHGGRDKALRGKPLTVKTTATTKVTRGDAVATLAAVVVGDHVNVKGTKAGSAYVATRVSAAPAEAADDTDDDKDTDSD